MTEQTELKPCPFCSGTFELIKTILGSYNLVHNPIGRCVIPRANEFYSEKSAISLVNNRPSEDALNARIAELEEAQRWIPIEERLPNQGLAQRYSVLLHGNYEEILVYSSLNPKYWYTNRNGNLIDFSKYVTHWRNLSPLPTAPEAQK